MDRSAFNSCRGKKRFVVGFLALLLTTGDAPASAQAESTAADSASVVYGDRAATPQTLYRVDGSGERVALTAGLDAIQPAWSPDARTIAFAGNFGGEEGGLFTVDAGGGSPQRLSTGHALYPSWSPDGLQIAFTGPGSHLWVVNADGTGLRQLTRETPPGFFADLYPSWAPDGSQVVFERLFESETGEAPPDEIRTVAVTGGAEQLVAYGRIPRWSPRGDLIAFSDVSRTYVVSAAGGVPEPIASGFLGGAWSPDGRELAVPEGEALRVVDVASRQTRTLVEDAPAEIVEPSWSGDGAWVAYSAADVFRVPAAGGSPERLSTSGLGRDPVAWPGIARRAAGPSRVETAVSVARQTHATGETVLIGSAADYPDALAGAPLALGEHAPILLNPRDALHPAVAAELDRLGTSRALVLGGSAAIAEPVLAELRARGLAVERVGGATRFETAAEIAQRLPETATAYLVQGASPDPARGWPDAVAVSGLAAAQQRPVLLTLTDQLPAATRQALVDREIAQVVVVGGTVAVGDEVMRELGGMGIAVERVHGPTRYDTSLEVARSGLAHTDLEASTVWLATGHNWPDSLAAGPAAARQGGLLLLVDGLDAGATPGTFAWLDDVGVAAAVLAGGPDVLVPDVLRAVNTTAAR